MYVLKVNYLTKVHLHLPPLYSTQRDSTSVGYLPASAGRKNSLFFRLIVHIHSFIMSVTIMSNANVIQW